MGGNCISAAEVRLDISPFGRIVLPMVLSAYVGADITTGILAVDLKNKKGTTLFIDIGTNGEIMVARDGKLVATSTAAGPAFEGMNIECGMRALSGAIESFQVDDDGSVEVGILGNQKATGICGSGLIDIAGELVRLKVINARGKIVADEPNLPSEIASRVFEREGKKAFKIDGDVFLSQSDVRQIQLAKGAIRTGIDCLLANIGVESSSVDEVLIAGSFGYHLRAKSLISIGLLAKEFEGKIKFVGNTSKTGGEALLRNYKLRDELKSIAKQTDVVELANTDDFQNKFVRSLGF
jgi:uncharacterized 2Fe-2S/4Fe-4S cluster protein (DUF4445 family)